MGPNCILHEAQGKSLLPPLVDVRYANVYSLLLQCKNVLITWCNNVLVVTNLIMLSVILKMSLHITPHFYSCVAINEVMFGNEYFFVWLLKLH